MNRKDCQKRASHSLQQGLTNSSWVARTQKNSRKWEKLPKLGIKIAPTEADEFQMDS